SVDRSSCQELFQSARAVARTGSSVLSFRWRRAISRASDRTCGGMTPWNECGDRSADLASFAARESDIDRSRRRISVTSSSTPARCRKGYPLPTWGYYNPSVRRRGEMVQFLTRAGHASVVLLEVIAFVWVGKKALELATRTRF